MKWKFVTLEQSVFNVEVPPRVQAFYQAPEAISPVDDGKEFGVKALTDGTAVRKIIFVDLDGNKITF